MGLEPLFERGNLAVLEAGRGGVVTVRKGVFILRLLLLQERADLPHLLQRGLFLLPLGGHRLRLRLEGLQFLLKLREALFGGVVLLLLERDLLDLQPPHVARNLVKLLRHRIHLGADARARLVEKVDRLVGQEAVLDVAARERHRAHERLVADVDVVVLLEALLEAAQDRDGVLLARRIDHHGLEAPLERRVLLHVLAVLVERRRADAVQLAARQERLEHVARVRRAFRLPRADDGVDLVDEEDDLAVRFLDLLQDGLQPLLELAAVHRARHQRGHVEREDLAVLQALGHVAAVDALREPFDDGRLADARLADQHGVVLRLARKDADDVADLGIAPDHGIELAALRERGQVSAVLLQAFLVVFRRFVGCIHVDISFAAACGGRTRL